MFTFQIVGLIGLALFLAALVTGRNSTDTH